MSVPPTFPGQTLSIKKEVAAATDYRKNMTGEGTSLSPESIVNL
jgi:hypothetical protein